MDYPTARQVVFSGNEDYVFKGRFTRWSGWQSLFSKSSFPLRGLRPEPAAIFAGKGSISVSDFREPAFGAGAVLVVEVDAVAAASSIPGRFHPLVKVLVVLIDVWFSASKTVSVVQVTAAEFFDDFTIDFEMGDGFVYKEDSASALFASRVYHLAGVSIAASF